MTDEPLPVVRIDDAERDRAVAFLRHHVAAGAITLDEFSDRVGQVFAATTNADIEVVTKDLPAVAARTTAPPTSRSRRAVNWTVAFMCHNQRRGRWRAEGETRAVSFLGHSTLDLRQAEVIGDEVTITAVAFLGGVDVVVPEGIEVVLSGLPIMGSNQRSIRDVPAIPGSPLVRVRGFPFMGGVTVRSKRPAGENSVRSKAESRREREERRAERRDRDRGRDRHGPPRGLDRPGPPSMARPPHLRRGIEAVAEDVRDEWSQLRSQVAPEGTVTIFFSDIEGFTSLNERVGDRRAQEVLRDHYKLVREELLTHRGFEVKVHGDGFMVAFDSAARALRCAKAIQRRQRAWTEQHPDTPLRVRMGLHTGEAIRDADDFLGSTVNLASRIATAARGEEILVSSLLKELCASTGEFDFDRGQEIELKGLSQPHRVFAVSWS